MASEDEELGLAGSLRPRRNARSQARAIVDTESDTDDPNTASDDKLDDFVLLGQCQYDAQQRSSRDVHERFVRLRAPDSIQSRQSVTGTALYVRKHSAGAKQVRSMTLLWH